jgi:hypothetical protein
MVLSASIAALFATGCESQETRELAARNAQMSAGEATRDSTFDATVTFCRKIGKKSGKRIGVGDRFQTAQKRYVHGLVDFHNVRPGRTYAVHLVWIRPDGREMFRRYAEVLAEQDSDGYVTVIDWKQAEDLGYLKTERCVSSEPAFTLSSRFNVSYSRQRIPGEYIFRVYLDRRLLMERGFTLDEG